MIAWEGVNLITVTDAIVTDQRDTETLKASSQSDHLTQIIIQQIGVLHDVFYLTDGLGSLSITPLIEVVLIGHPHILGVFSGATQVGETSIHISFHVVSATFTMKWLYKDYMVNTSSTGERICSVPSAVIFREEASFSLIRSKERAENTEVAAATLFMLVSV